MTIAEDDEREVGAFVVLEPFDIGAVIICICRGWGEPKMDERQSGIKKGNHNTKNQDLSDLHDTPPQDAYMQRLLLWRLFASKEIVIP